MTLEEEVAGLRAQLNALGQRVRLHSVAERFVAGDHEIRLGDYFLLHRETPTRLSYVSSEGKWTYFDGTHVVEPHRTPRQEDHARLYTIAEVAEILAKAPTQQRLRVALASALDRLETYDDDRGAARYPGEREWLDATRKEFDL